MKTTRTDKHIPTRMCVICRERFPKRELARFVAPGLAPGGTRVELVSDTLQILPGRGFYACAKPGCRERITAYRGQRKQSKGGSRC